MLAVLVVTSKKTPRLPQRRQRSEPSWNYSAVPESSRHVSHVAVTIEVKHVVMVCVGCVWGVGMRVEYVCVCGGETQLL